MVHIENNSGMCVPFSVRSTPDKGLGVFAEADVQAGTTVWRHVPGQYVVLDEESLTNLLASGSREDAVDVLTHIVSMAEFPGYMVRYFDEGALINHDEQPNVIRVGCPDVYQGLPVTSANDVQKALTETHFDLVASRDLAVGDELLMDYNDEPDDPKYYEEACRRYDVNWEWL